MLSPLAVVPNGHLPAARRGGRKRRSPITSYVVHMTGGGLPAKAIAQHRDVTEKAISYYRGLEPESRKDDISSHYLIAYDGTIYALTDESIRAPHVGVAEDERAAYLDGRWARGGKAKGQGDEGMLGPISDVAVRRWRAAWPQQRSPQYLFPSRFVNEDSVASEMTPCGPHLPGTPAPMRPGLRHTAEQHAAAGLLAHDLGVRHGWDGGAALPWWHAWASERPTHLLGHEDVDLFGRSNKGGGWDPGALRDEPWWDWAYVLRVIAWRATVPADHAGSPADWVRAAVAGVPSA
jgi:hypothetical protein